MHWQQAFSSVIKRYILRWRNIEPGRKLFVLEREFCKKNCQLCLSSCCNWYFINIALFSNVGKTSHSAKYFMKTADNETMNWKSWPPSEFQEWGTAFQAVEERLYSRFKMRLDLSRSLAVVRIIFLRISVSCAKKVINSSSNIARLIPFNTLS